MAADNMVKEIIEEAIVIDAKALPKHLQAPYQEILAEHKDDAGNLMPAGKLLFIKRHASSIEDRLKAVINGQTEFHSSPGIGRTLFKGGILLNADTNTSSSYKTGEFRNVFLTEAQFDSLLADTPFARFEADDDMARLELRPVDPALNADSFDEHAMIRCLSMAGVILRKVEGATDKPKTLLSRLANSFSGGAAQAVLPQAMEKQVKDMISHYNGRESELSPAMKAIYEDTVKRMTHVINGSSPAASSVSADEEPRPAVAG
ncbi:MAG: hypothetical protein LRZ85_01880 [Alphaproteobacteria bacterium]|nr:hypothetical protein [Alphaproteobacteria bacterium]MCD8526337.1 hypothetical protein [Alphaproteobacteria bacterium]MCD8570143.1 hypothetical protein [Alphaproteobacteria bacterium]